MVRLAALRYRWRGWWARPNQLFDRTRRSRTWGHCGGRRGGKTRAKAEAIRELIESGEVKRLAFMAQNEGRTQEICVDGPSGLIEVFPPWDRPSVDGGHLVWPNGCVGIPFTPQSPGNIRGDGVQLVWMTEIQSWPRSTMLEAASNARIMCSTPPALIFWDCTPKRRHPILRTFFKDRDRDPEAHQIVSEPIEANKDNLGSEVIADLRSTDALAGTQAGREELDGIFSDDDAGALWNSDWIEAHRRDEPTEYMRRIISVDPAITKRKGNDQTGISELGLGVDEQVYVIGDWTDQFAWEDWGDLVLDKYEMGKCDCVVVERNRGGDALAANLRARAESPERIRIGRRLKVVVVGAEARTRWVPGTVYVKEVHARGAKDERAGPVAGLYKAGKVSHVRSADLDHLEELLTTWVPDPAVKDSPDRMDPLVHGIWELARLGLESVVDSMTGLSKVVDEMKAQTKTQTPAASLAVAFGGGWGRGI